MKKLTISLLSFGLAITASLAPIIQPEPSYSGDEKDNPILASNSPTLLKSSSSVESEATEKPSHLGSVTSDPPSSSTSVILAARRQSACKQGYARSKKTNRCKKLVTVTKNKSSTVTKTWNPNTDKTTKSIVCNSGYEFNKNHTACNKIKTCQNGYALSKKTNRCKKLQTVTTSKSTILTKTWNPETDETTTTHVCRSGYWKNPKSDRCNKKKECKIGYRYLSDTNKCEKIKCKIGYQVQDSSNVCKRLTCKEGYIISQKTGNCVKNRHGTYKKCAAGWVLDLDTLRCAKIGTKGSNDPAFKNAKKPSKNSSDKVIKKGIDGSGVSNSKNTVHSRTVSRDGKIVHFSASNSTKKQTLPKYKTLVPRINNLKTFKNLGHTNTETKSDMLPLSTKFLDSSLRENVPKISVVLASTVKTPKTCPEGKFLNPKTNRCKNLQTISETSTTKTITTYDPKTGDATIMKICKDGYILDKNTDRCKKIPAPKTTSRATSTNSMKAVNNSVPNATGSTKLSDKTASGTANYTKTSQTNSASNSNDNKTGSNSNKSAGATPVTSLSEDDRSHSNSKPAKTCSKGKFLNPQTNRCKNLQTVSETSTGKTITTYDPKTGNAIVTKICNLGYELNAETNRCKKISQSSSSKNVSGGSKTTKTSGITQKTCPEGKFLNPQTNRCKKLQTFSESTTGKTITTYDPKTGEATVKKICNAGYELNEETNRCKKIKENHGESDSIRVPALGTLKKDNFIGTAATFALAGSGVAFLIFQFRHEIAKAAKNFVGKIHQPKTED